MRPGPLFSQTPRLPPSSLDFTKVGSGPSGSPRQLHSVPGELGPGWGLAPIKVEGSQPSALTCSLSSGTGPASRPHLAGDPL